MTVTKWVEHYRVNPSCAEDMFRMESEAKSSEIYELRTKVVHLEEENRQLQQYKDAFNEWLDKTDWVQKTGKAEELGKHRADILRERIEHLEIANDVMAEGVIEYKKWIEHLQAQIDRLMLEYCPDEMTQKQKDNWIKNQRRAEFDKGE